MANCAQCGEKFEISNEDLEFYDRVSPIFDGKKFKIPVPKLCPPCRQQRRLSFRNERALYKRKSDLSGKGILSIYSSDTPYKVFSPEEWWSDAWDPLEYGRDFDFSKTFNEQLKGLYEAVPHASLYTRNVENSDYTNYAIDQRNCYLVFGGGDNEDCLFGKFVVYCKDCVDCLTVYSCEFCYEGIASERCYGCRFFVNCRGCTDCLMVEDCLACSNCIACFGLQAKQYCIMNKQHSRDEYEKLAKEYEVLTHEKIENLRKDFDKLKIRLPHIQSHIFASENCTGDGIYNCKNCENAFDCKDCEDCKFMHFSPKCLKTQDCSFCAPDGVRFCYDVCSTLGLENSMFCFFTWRGSDIFYSIESHYCHNCFGCVGLKRAQYCIFNKQYSRQEYERLVARIIEYMKKTEEWGKYFFPEISPFAYNETIAQEYFPLTKDEVLRNGWKWKDKEEGDRPFKLIPQELKFYSRMKLPIPLKHPDIRHFERLKKHSVYRLWDRKCAKCGKKIATIYPPSDREKGHFAPLRVCCEACYLTEVY